MIIHIISVTSAFLNGMRYINPRFTYYLLTHCWWRRSHVAW